MPGPVSGDAEVRRAAERLAALGLQLAAANVFAARVGRVDPRSTFAREVRMVEEVLEDLMQSLPARLEAVEWRAKLLAQSLHFEAADRRRALRYRGEALGRYHRALGNFLGAVRGAGG